MNSIDAALVRKTWCETQSRFVVGATLATLVIVHAVLRAPTTLGAYRASHPGQTFGYGEYVWVSTFRGYTVTIWIFSAVLLGLGGLLREWSHGSAPFTLALPVTRRRVFVTRTLVGVIELVILGMLPAILLAMLSPIIGERFALGEGLLYSAAMICGGLVFYGWGLLLSTLVQGEFAAPTIGLVAVATAYFLLKMPALSRFNVFDVMSGAGHIDEATYFLERSIPLAPLGLALLLAFAMTCGAFLAVTRKDF